MPTYNKEKQMIANEKWRSKNHEHWTELSRIEAKKYYEKNRDTKSAKVLKNYYLKKELNAFLQILL